MHLLKKYDFECITSEWVTKLESNIPEFSGIFSATKPSFSGTFFFSRTVFAKNSTKKV